MKDKDLSAVEKNKKIQDIMAGKVELPKVEAKKPPVVDQEESGSDSESEYSESGSESSQSYSEEEEEDSVDTTGKPVNKEDEEDSIDTTDEPVSKQSAIVDAKLKQASKASKIVDAKLKEAEVSSANNSTASSSSHSRRSEEDRRPTKHVAIKEEERSSSSVASRGKDASTQRQGRNDGEFKRLPSNDGGIRTNISHEWKQRMLTVHPRSHDNLLDILLAHQYRLSLKTPPNQSFFRVVAVVFFSRVVDGVRRDERYHVVGTNDEPHSIGGSICAERAALMQLRFIPDLEEITKVVIVTDHVDAISPGMLCREFMASHNRIPWDCPIVLGRSVCRKCGFTVSGKVCSDFNGCFDEEENDILRDVNSNIFATCSKGHEESKNPQYDTPHDFVGTVTTLKDLFPYPSLYTRLSSTEAMKMGQEFMEKGNSMAKSKATQANISAPDSANGGVMSSYRQERFDLGMLTEIMEEGDEEDAGSGNDTGGQNQLNGSMKSSATSLRKNGQQNDSFTSNSTNGRKSASPVKSSMTHSLKTTIDFMRLVREDNELDSSLTNLTDMPGALDHLTARTLRISSRLKPSQRREKLMRLATEVTAMESHRKHAHPMRYGAAVLFSDFTVAIASQKVALEYGCTLDAVGQLASTIDRKALQVNEDNPTCRPILLVQCDHFGIAHAPFAQGRAFLSERGYGDCKILIHQQKKKKSQGESNEEEDLGVSVSNGMNAEVGEEMKLRLLEVDASDLAPSPPDMFGSGLITKNHAHSQGGGLQIQF